MLAIKDMAGLLRPQAAAILVGALRSRFDLPVHVHTHDTPGGQLATYLAAWQAGANAVDGASSPLAGTTSQPALSSIVAAAAHTEYDTGLSLSAVCDLEPYWEALRKVYAPFECRVCPAPTGRVYTHEIPGGQLSNLRQQAIALGFGDRFEDIEANYAAADRVLGRLVKVTPSSQGGRRSRAGPGGCGLSADEFAADPGTVRHPRLGDRIPARRTRRPARRLAGTVAHQGACRSPPAKPTRSCRREDEAALAQPGVTAAGDVEPTAVPRSDKGIRGAS